MNIPVGTVIRYFETAGMALIRITDQNLRVGDVIQFSGISEPITQAVTELRIGHTVVDHVASGDTCVIPVTRAVVPGSHIYLVSQP